MYFQNFPADLFKNINPTLIETVNGLPLSTKLLNVRKNLKEAIFEMCYQFYPALIKESLNEFYVEYPFKKQKFFLISQENIAINSQEAYELDVKFHILEYLPFLFGAQRTLSCTTMSTSRYKELETFLVFLELKLSSKLAEDGDMLIRFANELPCFFIKKMNTLSIDAIVNSLELRSLNYWKAQCGYSSLKELTAELYEWHAEDTSINAIRHQFIEKIDSLYVSSFLNWSPSLFFTYVDEKNIVAALLKNNLIRSDFFNFMSMRLGKVCGSLDVLIEKKQFAVIEALVVNGVLNPSHFKEVHFIEIFREENNELLCKLFECDCIRPEWIDREMFDSSELKSLMPSSFKEKEHLSACSISTTTSSQNLSGLATPAAPIFSPSPIGAEVLCQVPIEDVRVKKMTYHCSSGCSMF